MRFPSAVIVLPSDEDVQSKVWQILVDEGLEPAPLEKCPAVPLSARELAALVDAVEHMAVHVDEADLTKPFRLVPLTIDPEEARAILANMKDRIVQGARQHVHLIDYVVWADTDQEATALERIFHHAMSETA